MVLWFLPSAFLLLFFSPITIHGGLSRQGSTTERLESDDQAFQFDPTRVSHISWIPRAFHYKGFLTGEECDHLIELAKDKLEKSTVTASESGERVESDIRTSSGMFIEKAKDDVVRRIEERIAIWTFLPRENGEPIQILRYQHDQKYDTHVDYFDSTENWGHRIATVLMYLSDVDKGGETVFPDSESKELQPKDDSWSECAKQGYAVKARKGDALLFFSLHPDANPDPRSLHASCPVIEGEKWSATKWIHVRSFDKSTTEAAAGCVDKHPSCAAWAADGYCEKNPAYMVGGHDADGYCMKSCRLC